MKKALLIFSILAFITMSYEMPALPKKSVDDLQRKANGTFDLQRNTKSNFEFMLSNYGIIGFDIQNGTAGGYWPRGSKNKYMFAGGFWFGAIKARTNPIDTLTYCTVSYNPNSGKSWFVPGRIEDGDSIHKNMDSKYRIYFSTDFDKYTGTPYLSEDGPNWPLWIEDSIKKYQYGTFRHKYENDVNLRNRTAYPYGPMFESDEDIISTFKDTDLNYYEGGIASRKERGYPLGLQVDSKIYTWDNEEMKDVVIQSYLIENISKDTLWSCWFGGVYDLDLTYDSSAVQGAGNDRTRFFEEEPELNTDVTWTNTDRGEAGKGFGYIGLSFLEGPALDQNNFIRNDKYIFEPQEQIGMVTSRNWNTDSDPLQDDARYKFMSAGIRDGDVGPGDKRIMMATGPFHLRPGDIARVVISYTFAMPAKGGEADGTYEDLTGISGKTNKDINPNLQANSNSLISKIRNTRAKYYQYAQTDVDENTNSGFSIKEVYPNPVNHFFNIDFNLENAGNVRISINDQLGKEAGLLFDGWKEAGNQIQNVSIDKSKLYAGVYFITLQTENKIKTKKIVIVK